MRELLNIFLLVTFAEQSLQSFCGSAGVPFSFEVLPSGAPVLGCAQPSCVAAPENTEEDSNFLTDAEGQSDGFFRDGDKELKRYRDQSARKLIAKCSGKFADLSCPRKDQWVGGIEYIDHPRQPLILQCCSFEGLRFSQDVGVTNVGPGEAITGGEVVRDGRQISFDVIANVRKVMDANTHEISYEVTVRRMNCLPDPPEPEVPFDDGVSEEVVKILTKATNGGNLGTENKFIKKSSLDQAAEEKAFGALTQKSDRKKFLKKKNNVHRSLTTAKPESELGHASPLPEIAGKADSKGVSPLPLPSAEQVSVQQQGAQNSAKQQVQPAQFALSQRSFSIQPQFGAQNLASHQTQYAQNVPPGQQQQPSLQSSSNGQSNFRFINVAVSPTQSQNPRPGDAQQQQQHIPQQAGSVNSQAQNSNMQQGQVQNGFAQQNYPNFNRHAESTQSNNGGSGINYDAASTNSGSTFAGQGLNNQNTNADQPGPIVISQANVYGHYVYNQDQAKNYNKQQHPSYSGNVQSGSVIPPQSPVGTPPPIFPQQTFTTPPPYQFNPAAATPRPFLPLSGSYGPQQYQGVGAGNVGAQPLFTPSPAFQPQPFQASFPLLPAQTPASSLLFGAPLFGFPQPGIIPLAPLARGDPNVQQAAVDPLRATALLADQSAKPSQPPLPQAPSALPSPTLPPLPSFEQMMGMFGVRNGTLATLPAFPTLPTLPPFSPFSVPTPPPASPFSPQGVNNPLPSVPDAYGRLQQHQGHQDNSGQLQSSVSAVPAAQQPVNAPPNPTASEDSARSPLPSRQK